MMKKFVTVISTSALAAVLAFVAFTAVTFTAFAEDTKKIDQSFRAEIAKLSDLCTSKTCKEPYAKQLTFHHKRKKNIEIGLKILMERIAFSQAQLWGDTILEGDYVADGKTRLDQVTVLYKNNKLIGYLVRYSEKAWDTSSIGCAYDGIHDETLAGCAQGRIIESTYVSPDSKDYFNNEKTWAVFRLNSSTEN